MYVLRRILNPMGTMDAIDFLLDKLRNTKNNSEFSANDAADDRFEGSRSQRQSHASARRLFSNDILQAAVRGHASIRICSI